MCSLRSQIGPCVESTGSYTGECFEPADALKGDLSRSYFYLSTLYDGAWECCDDVATDKAKIDAWEEAVLRKWHELDAVDDMERRRNDVIYSDWQKNRNPYIDHPEFVSQISDF